MRDIDKYSQNKAKNWLEGYINELGGINSDMMRARGYAYRRAYKNALKTARELLSQKMGKTYEIFHGDWLSFEDFIINNPIERLLERFVEYSKSYTGNDNISVNAETKKSICCNFTKHLNLLTPITERYDAFFHNLVFYMRYKEHMAIPGTIGAPETMRKNEMVTEQPPYPISQKLINSHLIVSEIHGTGQSGQCKYIFVTATLQ